MQFLRAYTSGGSVWSFCKIRARIDRFGVEIADLGGFTPPNGQNWACNRGWVRVVDSPRKSTDVLRESYRFNILGVIIDYLHCYRCISKMVFRGVSGGFGW